MNHPFRPALLCILLVGFGGLLGILFQKHFPVGRLLHGLTAASSPHGPSDLDAAFTPTSPPASLALVEATEKVTLSMKAGSLSEAQEALRSHLLQGLAAEIAFRDSKDVASILESIRSARSTGGLAPVEFQWNRIFCESNLRGLQRDTPEELAARKEVQRIAAFASFLSQEGTHLIYCPVPNPLDTCLAIFCGEETLVSARPGHTRFLMALVSEGVDVIDLRPSFLRSAAEGKIPFHRFDHHWNPQGIELASDVLTRELNHRIKFSNRPLSSPDGAVAYRWISTPASDWNIELAPPGTSAGSLFAREVLYQDRLIPTVDSSPIWLMGDSMLLDYSPTRTGIAADLGSHLAGRIKIPIHPMARPGTIDIRQGYLLGTSVAAHQPSILIWIHSDEFFELPEVDLERTSTSGQEFSGKARVVEVSRLPDAKTSPYPDAIVSFKAELLLPRDQTSEAIIHTWGFRGRQPSINLESISPGSMLEVQLIPWAKALAERPELGRVQLVDQVDNPSGRPIFWWKTKP